LDGKYFGNISRFLNYRCKDASLIDTLITTNNQIPQYYQITSIKPYLYLVLVGIGTFLTNKTNINMCVQVAFLLITTLKYVKNWLGIIKLTSPTYPIAHIHLDIVVVAHIVEGVEYSYISYWVASVLEDFLYYLDYITIIDYTYILDINQIF